MTEFDRFRETRLRLHCHCRQGQAARIGVASDSKNIQHRNNVNIVLNRTDVIEDSSLRKISIYEVFTKWMSIVSAVKNWPGHLN